MMAAQREQPRSRLRELLRGLAEVAPALDRPVTALALDSRAVVPGAVFFARRGGRVDGACFAADARAAGACAMVEQGTAPARLDPRGLLRVAVGDVPAAAGLAAHRFHGHPTERLRVVAVTGTNGKTSVCHFVAAALERLGHGPVGVLGTLGAGLAGALRDTGLTTPDCIAVHAAMAGFRDAGARFAVLEASSHALAQSRLAAVHVDVAVFTNLSRDHLDYHRDMDDYARAKARLFAAQGLRAAVINAADPAAAVMRRALAAGTPVLGFALDAPAGAELRGRLLAADASGIVLEAHHGRDRVCIRSALPGRAAACNLLAALGVLLAGGVPAADAAAALSRVGPVPGRMQPVGGGTGAPLLLVDYAHTPDALQAALEAARALGGGRLWCVFGAGGERDRGKRPLMGACAARLADEVVITDDNPRGEDPRAIAGDILAGVPAAARARLVIGHDRARAIALAAAQARPGDVVLVAGKGHETVQEVAGECRPFSDVAAARAALARRTP